MTIVQIVRYNQLIFHISKTSNLSIIILKEYQFGSFMNKILDYTFTAIVHQSFIYNLIAVIFMCWTSMDEWVNICHSVSLNNHKHILTQTGTDYSFLS